MLKLFERFFAVKGQKEEAIASQRLLELKGVYAQYNPSDLVGRQGLRVFTKMRKDDQIKAALSLKKNAVLAPGWDIKSPEGESEDWEPREFVLWCLSYLDGTFEADLREVMSALDYGFSVTEKIYKKVDKGDWAGKICLKELKGKDPETFEPVADEYGNLVELNQIVGYKREPLSIPKFVFWAHNMEWGNWYGESDLEAAYPAWWSKVNAYKWLAIALEKYAIPPLIMLYQSGVFDGNKQAQLKTFLTSLQSNSVGAVPRNQKDDVEFWTPTLGNQIKDFFLEAIAMYNQDIARALLVPQLIGVTPDSDAGSYARSQTHFDLFSLQLDQLRREIAERVVNEQIIKPLCDLNFPGLDDYPYFEWLPLTVDRRQEILSSWKDLLNAGAVHSQLDDEKHIRELLEFPELDEDALEEDTQPASPDPDEAPQDGSIDSSTPDDAPAQGAPMPEAEKDRAFSFVFSREKTRYEKKVDFKLIVKTLDNHEADIKGRLRDAIKSTQEQVIKKINGSYNKDAYGLIENLKLGNAAQLRRAVEDLIDGAFNQGRTSIAPQKFRDSLPGVEAKEALRWLRAQKISVSGILSDRLLSEIRRALLESIRAGDTTQDAVERVKSVLLAYTADPERDVKNKLPLKPWALETIVRTNTTQAYNMGRIVELRRNPLVAGVQYSAIIDERTTEVCQHLDGKVFKAGDSDLDALTPPNHYNCRSLLVPIMIDEAPDEKDFITPGEVGKAKEQAGKGFV